MPELADHGLVETDLKRATLRDVLLSEELTTVIVVVGTAVAIWYFSWWGIAVACAGLAVLYGLRRVVELIVKGPLDRARAAYDAEMELYNVARRAHDIAMDEWESKMESQK
tara:strand:- start:313 stop:645 length:333 start_codon:yes stop_codon:yes gene_type:complete